MGETIKYHQITDSLKTIFFVAGFCLHTSKRAKIFKIKLKEKKNEVMTKMRFKPHWIPPECFR